MLYITLGSIVSLSASNNLAAIVLSVLPVQIGIAGVPADCIMKKTKTLEDNWSPTWNEAFEFPLTVPELALLRVEVHEYDMSEKDDFGGQTCLPIWEIRKGIRAVPLHDRKGEKYKSVKLLMRFDFIWFVVSDCMSLGDEMTRGSYINCLCAGSGLFGWVCKYTYFSCSIVRTIHSGLSMRVLCWGDWEMVVFVLIKWYLSIPRNLHLLLASIITDVGDPTMGHGRSCSDFWFKSSRFSLLQLSVPAGKGKKKKKEHPFAGVGSFTGLG